MRLLFQNNTIGVNGVKTKSFFSVTFVSLGIVFLSFFATTPAFLHSHLVNNTLSKQPKPIFSTASVLEGITDVVSNISSVVSSVANTVTEITGFSTSQHTTSGI